MLAMASTASAVPIVQYADTVLDFSSQYSSGNWSAQQALGASNTNAYGDIVTAWAPSSRDGTLEFLTLGFATAVYSDGAIIRETYGNGFVHQVDVLDLNDTLHTVWSGTDTALAGSVSDFQVIWDTTNFLTRGIKIYVDTSHNMSAWEQIDLVQLTGRTTIPEPGILALIFVGLGGMRFARRLG
jgi:hypothetical protein